MLTEPMISPSVTRIQAICFPGNQGRTRFWNRFLRNYNSEMHVVSEHTHTPLVALVLVYSTMFKKGVLWQLIIQCYTCQAKTTKWLLFTLTWIRAIISPDWPQLPLLPPKKWSLRYKSPPPSPLALAMEDILKCKYKIWWSFRAALQECH